MEIRLPSSSDVASVRGKALYHVGKASHNTLEASYERGKVIYNVDETSY